MNRPPRNTYSLLIVDDEEGIRHGLSNFFKKKGFRAFAVGDYKSALTKASQNKIDMAIVDIRLKGDKNGIDLISNLKNIEPDMLVIVITGYGSIDTAVKEVLARYIHFTSSRKEKKFVSINCAALSGELLLSELFGHEKGAFTGAIERKMGKFEIAHGGTLFLDEIGDMSPDIQAKLIRVIEENSFERVGGTKRIDVDVRIIAATNRDLEKLMEKGEFREDLYYRINVVSFFLPPLRERKEDIPILTRHFIQKYNLRYKKSIKDFDEATHRMLLLREWQGNVRELENVINQAALLSNREIITLDGLKKSTAFTSSREAAEIDYTKITSLKDTISDLARAYEKRIIRHFLTRNNFNKSKTAGDLSITRKTLDVKIERYGL